jgi:hypothetical protein
VSGLTDGKDKKSHRPNEKRLGVSIAVVELIAAFIDLHTYVDLVPATAA